MFYRHARLGTHLLQTFDLWDITNINQQSHAHEIDWNQHIWHKEFVRKQQYYLLKIGQQTPREL